MFNLNTESPIYKHTYDVTLYPKVLKSMPNQILDPFPNKSWYAGILFLRDVQEK